MVRPSIAASLAQLQALSLHIDLGSNPATVVFYKGAKPLDVTVAADSANALVTLPLERPSLLSVEIDSIELKPVGLTNITATGTATWARVYNGNGAAVMDLAVGTDISLSTVDFVSGEKLQMPVIILRPSNG